ASLTVNDTTFTRVAAGTVTTTGAQSYAKQVALLADDTFISTGAGNISFDQIDNNFKVAVTTAGETNFNTAVGPPVPGTALATDALGTTNLAGNVTVNKTVTFNDAVTISGVHAVTSLSNEAISFNSTLDGLGALTATTSGDTTFAQAVGGSVALASITTNGG